MITLLLGIIFTVVAVLALVLLAGAGIIALIWKPVMILLIAVGLYNFIFKN